jgi:type IV pilus biogenesis protein CpaD/CtpE
MRHVSKIGIMVFAVAVVATAIAVGCASKPPLRTEGTTSGIRAAEEVGASGVPQASLHLQLAKEELASAEKLSAKNEPARAESMLSRAEADAELAVLLSRESTERKQAQAAVARVHKLRRNNINP